MAGTFQKKYTRKAEDNINFKQIVSVCKKAYPKDYSKSKEQKSLLDLIVSLDQRLTLEEAKNAFFRKQYPEDIAEKINNLADAVAYAIQNSGFILDDTGDLTISINGNTEIKKDIPDGEKLIVDKYFFDYSNIVNVFQNLDDFEVSKFRKEGTTAIYVGEGDSGHFLKSHTYRFNGTIDNWEDVSFGTIVINCVKDSNENVTFDKDPSVVFSTLMSDRRNLVVVKYFDNVFLPISKIDQYGNGEVKITFSNSYLTQGKNKILNSTVIEAICNSNNLSEWSSIRFYSDSEAIVSPKDIDRAEGVAAAAISMSQEALDRTDAAIEAANKANTAAEEAKDLIARIQIIDPSEVESMLD